MRWLVNALVVLLAAALPLAAVEAWLRATAPPADTPELFVRVPSPMEWLGRPGARGMHAGVEVAFNEHGLRDEQRAPPAAPDTVRILALGDSVTFGMGVPRQDAYPAQAEALLNASTGGSPRIEVLNFGIPGYNTLHSLAQLRELGLGLRPDIVVLGFLYNDVELSSGQREPSAGADEGAASPPPPSLARSLKSMVNAGALFLKQNSLAFAWLTPRLGLALRPLGFSGFGQVGSFKEQYADSNPNWQRMRAAILEMQRLGHEQGFELALMVIPAMARFDASYPLKEYHHAVASFGAQNGIPTLDLLPAFWGLDGSRFWISPTDGHPDAQAHRIMARALADFLRPMLQKAVSH